MSERGGTSSEPIKRAQAAVAAAAAAEERPEFEGSPTANHLVAWVVLVPQRRPGKNHQWTVRAYLSHSVPNSFLSAASSMRARRTPTLIHQTYQMAKTPQAKARPVDMPSRPAATPWPAEEEETHSAIQPPGERSARPRPARTRSEPA